MTPNSPDPVERWKQMMAGKSPSVRKGVTETLIKLLRARRLNKIQQNAPVVLPKAPETTDPDLNLKPTQKNDLLKRVTIDNQEGAKGKAQAEQKNPADPELGGFALTRQRRN